VEEYQDEEDAEEEEEEVDDEAEEDEDEKEWVEKAKHSLEKMSAKGGSHDEAVAADRRSITPEKLSAELVKNGDAAAPPPQSADHPIDEEFLAGSSVVPLPEITSDSFAEPGEDLDSRQSGHLPESSDLVSSGASFPPAPGAEEEGGADRSVLCPAAEIGRPEHIIPAGECDHVPGPQPGSGGLNHDGKDEDDREGQSGTDLPSVGPVQDSSIKSAGSRSDSDSEDL